MCFRFVIGLLIFLAITYFGGINFLTNYAQAANYSLRFYGHGVNDIDRIKIPLDNPPRPIDVGSTDFTIEFWLKANESDNTGTANCNQNDGWITANIIFDRDIYGAGDYGDYGIALSNGVIVFGVNNGSNGTTLCGTTNVGDGVWHHIAITRQSSTGQIRIFVDGNLDAQSVGPTGNISYRDGRSTSFPNSDPFLVIGAEKHDAGSTYPSYNGLIDEIRVSNILRYTSNFTRPSEPFTTDANTVALYHFDEGPAGACTGIILDSSEASGGQSNGACKYGGSTPAGPVYTTDTPFTLNNLTITLQGTGTGTVTSDPAGINCGVDCTELYDYNTVVTLTAIPDPGSIFAGWSGYADCLDGIVTMDTDKTCMATFNILKPDLTGSWTAMTKKIIKSGSNYRGESIKGTLKVENIGNFQVPSGVRILFYLSNDGTSLNKYITVANTSSPINPNSYINVPFTYYSRSSVTGKYIIVVIDSNNQIDEASETNNNVASSPLP